MRIIYVPLVLIVTVILISSSSISIVLNNISTKQFSNLELIGNEPIDKFKTSAGLAPNFAAKNDNIPLVSKEFDYISLGYGYIINSSVFNQGTCYFDIEDPETIGYLNDTESDDFLSGGTGFNGKWIACENSTGALWEIAPESGDMIYIGGGGVGLTGLAHDSQNNRLFGASISNLYEIDPDDGTQEFIGGFGNDVDKMIGIAMDYMGDLYGWDLGDKLWIINTDTGEATEIGPLGIDLNYAQDGGFDWELELLFLTAFTVSPNYGSYLYVCDVETGECTIIGQFKGNSQITASVITLGWWCCEHDVGIKKIICPNDGYANEEMNVLVRAKNYGNNSEEDVPITVAISKNGIEEYNETVIVDIEWDEFIDVEMPSWTPEDWQNISNDYIEYKILAYTLLSNDNDPNNDCKEKWFVLNYGYFHDVSFSNVNEPESNPAQTFQVKGNIKNLGQYDECFFNAYLEIAEVDLDSQVELLTEDFSDFTFPPQGWIITHNNWNYSNSKYAGGSLGEAGFNHSPESNDFFRLYTPALDTGNYDTVEIEFKQFVDHYKYPYSLIIETSEDGEIWNVVWDISPTSHIEAETVNILTKKNIGSTTYFSWTFKGHSGNIDNWYIDDIVINGYNTFAPEYEDNLSISNIEPGEKLDLEFNNWTPDFLQYEITDTKKYSIKAWTEMEDPPDENLINDLFRKSIILDFFHDIGIKEIIFPYYSEFVFAGENHKIYLENSKFKNNYSVQHDSKNFYFDNPNKLSVPADRYIQLGYHDVSVIVENIGTFPELNLTCYAEIYEYITNCSNGTLIYRDNISNIDLNEPLGGNKSLYFNEYNFSTEGLYVLYLNIPDNNDDYTNNNNVIIGIGADSTPPVSNHSIYPETPDGENGWYVSDLTVTLTAEDPRIGCDVSGSGVDYIKYSIDEQQGTIEGDTGAFVVHYDGNDVIIEYWAVDHVGNIESKHSFIVDMDQTIPDIDPEGVQWETFKENPTSNIWYVRFWINSIDETSGMDKVIMYINDKEHKVNDNPDGYLYEFIIMWSSDFKNINFKFSAFDKAGNSVSDFIKGSEIKSHKHSTYNNRRLFNNILPAKKLTY